MSQYLWYNENIQVNKNSIYLIRFSEKNINYVSQLFRPDGSIKTWHEPKTERELHENFYSQWLQPVSSISEGWKFIIKETHKDTTNLIYDHPVIKGSRVLTLDKLTSTEIYSILISEVQNKPSFNFYFENLVDDNNIDWAAIYMLLGLGTYNTYMRSF